jgi:exodeoxyribonuclease-5
LSISPALDKDTLTNYYNKEVIELEMDEVVRQQQDSGILVNATEIRNRIEDGLFEAFKFSEMPYPEVTRPLDGQELLDAIQDSYAALGNEDTVIIVRSNKRANLYNQNIRNRILFQEEELSAGDYLMVVKNNYFWQEDKKSTNNFIANGDIVEVMKIKRREEQYGFNFADCLIRFIDNPTFPEMEIKLITDCLYTEAPALNFDQQKLLFENVKADLSNEVSNAARMAYVRKSEFYNALQIKFSYAITCHKAQGGQWSVIFIDQGYLNSDQIDRAYLRWLYTAVTRATKKVYLLNFNELFFS